MPPVDRILRRACALGVTTLLVAACGGSGGKKAVPTTTGSTTPGSTPSAAPITAAKPPTAPLTGLPQPDSVKRSRPALAIKIDNVDPARPQAGLAAADVVYEELVESRLTRLIALFQSTDADRIGPVRSTRTTDIDIVSALNHPLYAYSGGNTGFVAQLRAAPVSDVGADARGGAYFTSGPHAQPHNLYTTTAALFGLDTSGTHPPPPLFDYRAAGQAPSGAGVAPASHIDMSFGMAAAAWDWDAASATWKRTQNGSPDIDQAGQQLAANNVIVQVINYTIDGYATGEGVVPAPPIPKGQSVGSGSATILTGGTVIRATWSKASPTAVTQFADSAGQPIALAPGRTWVELLPPGPAPNMH
jgi:hypothetical protein